MPQSALPECLATVARLRAEKVPEPEIAERLGVDTSRLWRMVANWNARHPANRVPRPATRPRATRIEQTAALIREGRTLEEIATAFQCTRTRVLALRAIARRKNLLDGPSRTPRATYMALYTKGAVPRRGRVTDVLECLDARELERLLAYTSPDDKTLAQSMARVIKEHFDARKE